MLACSHSPQETLKARKGMSSQHPQIRKGQKVMLQKMTSEQRLKDVDIISLAKKYRSGGKDA